MRVTHLYLLSYVFLTACVLLNVSAEPATVIAGVVGTAAVVYVLGPKVWSHYHESCDTNWINYNATGLHVDLRDKLVGQHIASNIIMRAVDEFMRNKPRKPLVLSLHGWTGTGKNFASQLIARNLYKKGVDSSFVHLITPELHFPHSSLINNYKSQIHQWISGNISQCEQSMFIFDEMDKMHPELIESIKPFLRHYTTSSRVSNQKAIFIFLSNAGGQRIVQTAFSFRKEGRNRQDIELDNLEVLLSLTKYNKMKSGMWPSSLIDTGLVDFFIPFLPLEHQHVVQCALASMINKGHWPNVKVAEQVAQELVYFPKSDRMFSIKGCKTIDSKVDFYV
ncbi:uncharacterized protein V6R79_002390 [Siganus canaliculatus]